MHVKLLYHSFHSVHVRKILPYILSGQIHARFHIFDLFQMIEIKRCIDARRVELSKQGRTGLYIGRTQKIEFFNLFNKFGNLDSVSVHIQDLLADAKQRGLLASELLCSPVDKVLRQHSRLSIHIAYTKNLKNKGRIRISTRELLHVFYIRCATIQYPTNDTFCCFIYARHINLTIHFRLLRKREPTSQRKDPLLHVSQLSRVGGIFYDI